jgi:tetrahydromethanopterin S-methyltransferase subunit G
MGFVFSMMPRNITLTKKILQGILVGLLISFAFYSTMNFNDLPGFIVGGLYGVIIELVFHFVYARKQNVSKNQ